MYVMGFVCRPVPCLWCAVEALLSFLDLLATTFPGSDNRAGFRGLAEDLRLDKNLNDLTRCAES